MIKYLNIVLIIFTALILAAEGVSCHSTSGIGGKTENKSYLGQIAGLEKPAGVEAGVWQDLLDEFQSAMAEAGADKRVAAAPSGDNGKAVGLSAAGGTGGAMVLKWRYRNTGDYDQDGEVGVPDITPIATNYLKNTTSPDWLDVIVIDGDGSGDIGVPDITPIANNYLNRIDGYLVETSDTSGGNYTEVEESPWTDGHAPTGTVDVTKNWYDGNGDTAGFGIPDGLTGNLATGETFFNTTCSGCHPGGRDNYTYQQFRNALATQPAMSALSLSDQEVANVTAYSNRNNADTAPDVFDGNGNTSGFGIPAMTSGNITTGEGIYTTSCSGCHATGTKDGRTYSEFETALAIPAMSGLSLTTQQKADITAYLNRDNGIVAGPVDAFLEFSHDVTAPVNGNFYRVTPFEGTGGNRTLGMPSDPVQYGGGTGTPPAAPTGVAASDGDFASHIAVTWTKSSGATGYKVYRDSQATPVITLGDVATYDDTLVIDTDLHTYWVKAFNGDGDSGFSDSDTGYKGGGTAGLKAPSSVQATDGEFSNKITVTWVSAPDATGYKLYRDTMTTPVDQVGAVETYDDTAVTDSQLHSYWVVSTDGTNDSGFSAPDTGYISGTGTSGVTVFGFNDLGMHCMNQDFSELMILPPYNTLHALVVDRRGGDPQIRTSGITVNYTIPGNTHSSDKTNFWSYVDALLGASPAPDVGLAGFGLSGEMAYQGANGRTDWAAVGIPVTPINDEGVETPYNLATITVTEAGNVVGSTKAVVPVSWEISCDLCHSGNGVSVGTDILRKHDSMHGTTLEDNKPVLCGTCHAQPELGLTGMGGLPTLSSAMHTAHSPRMAMAGLDIDCYACHPGQRTQCLRDVHATAGLDCHTCHGQMSDVGDPGRTPWASEPKCSTCHNVAGHEYEEPGKLYRESRGHMGVYCEACHGSPHAITPTINPEDNVQALLLQGHTGVINTCSLCHSETPGDPFPHTLTGD